MQLSRFARLANPVLTVDPGSDHPGDSSKLFKLLLQLSNLLIFAVKVRPSCFEQARQVLLQHCAALPELLILRSTATTIRFPSMFANSAKALIDETEPHLQLVFTHVFFQFARKFLGLAGSSFHAQ